MSAAPTELVRPSCSTRPLARSLSPRAAAVILMVKSRVATAQPFGIRVRQDATAAISPAVPTIEAGKRLGGPENLSSNGSSTVTAPGLTDTRLMENARTNARADMKDRTSLSSSRFAVSDIDRTLMATKQIQDRSTIRVSGKGRSARKPFVAN